MNSRRFSQNPRKRGKSHYHCGGHCLNLFEAICETTGSRDSRCKCARRQLETKSLSLTSGQVCSCDSRMQQYPFPRLLVRRGSEFSFRLSDCLFRWCATCFAIFSLKKSPPSDAWHYGMTAGSEDRCFKSTFLFEIFFGLDKAEKKEDFLENLHVLSSFVLLISVLLISCVFWILDKTGFDNASFFAPNRTKPERAPGYHHAILLGFFFPGRGKEIFTLQNAV